MIEVTEISNQGTGSQLLRVLFLRL